MAVLPWLLVSTLIVDCQAKFVLLGRGSFERSPSVEIRLLIEQISWSLVGPRVIRPILSCYHGIRDCKVLTCLGVPATSMSDVA